VSSPCSGRPSRRATEAQPTGCTVGAVATHVSGTRTIGYDTHGEGAPILVIHGTTQSRTGWDQVRAACSAPLQWVTVEMPGSGESSMPEGPIDLDQVCDDFADLMKVRGHERYHVAGYSLGAVMALHLAARHPGAVESVTSVCGWARTDARMRLTFDLWRRLLSIGTDLFMRYALVDGYTAETLEVLEPMADAAVQLAATMIQPGSDAQLELDARIDIVESLAKVVAPCLVIGGLQDRWVDVSKSRDIVSRVAGSRLVEIDAGHLLIGERADAVAALISEHARV